MSETSQTVRVMYGMRRLGGVFADFPHGVNRKVDWGVFVAQDFHSYAHNAA